MKFKVNEACIGCGLCVNACPEVFHMTSAGVAESTGSEVEPEYEGAAKETQAGCPVSAIEEA